MVLITVLISFITLIFGELVPKRIALQKPEMFSMLCAKPILFISKIASPFIKILSWSTKMVLRIFHIKDENVEESLSREEIRALLESGQENGAGNREEKDPHRPAVCRTCRVRPAIAPGRAGAHRFCQVEA